MESFTTFDFQQAKARHLLFKSRLRAILYDEGDVKDKTVLSQYACPVGKWIYSHALIQYESIPEVHDLERVHGQLHIIARDLVKRYQEGYLIEARNGLPAMEKVADTLVELLQLIEQKVKAEEVPISNAGLDTDSMAAFAALLAKNERLDSKIKDQVGKESQFYLKTENERQVLHNFFMQAPAAFCIMRGPEHIFELVNPDYQKLIGGRSLVGKTVRQAMPELAGQGFYELLNNVFTTRKPFIGKKIFIRLEDASGKARDSYLDMIYQPTFTRHGETDGILVFAYEVTEQVLAQQQVDELVQQRTFELKQANANLERSNKELGQVAFVASHDLQEPLRKIRLYASGIQHQYQELLPEKARDYVNKIVLASERMSLLIKDMLDFARVAQSSHSFVETDLNEVLQRVLIDYETVITDKRAVIESETLPIILAAPLQMPQLFSNLVGNALKFSSDTRAPYIQIRSRKLSEETVNAQDSLVGNEAYYEIIVQDNGIGFKPEYSEKIFTMFQRIHNRKGYEGNGIGLTLCRRIVENHAGKLYANSIENQGATFQIILPVKQPDWGTISQ